ncbi:hypothetical protein [Bradyrhizobium sacchari]|uniref:Uncharacterized protein n=1 Tax=Bradyrhizobium sacchari TaxID=1399419 RepID=A0A560KKD3_9BRAD|nr:hypothetical protein [Bradyrhizobium sacchari]TWB66385.1 hypothetical protein FBZ94_10156 [Bradyrhizobium sacchari]TWB83622.1 hypothetical protein FBZ95_10156 [Bradyrhizobium sacchari]
MILTASTLYTVAMSLQFVTETFSGGPEFWLRVEKSLYRFADQPDLPPEKKAKIVAALKKIREKNQPYIDALTGKE